MKIHANKKNESGYKADIKINQLYKGEALKSIYVHGRSDNKLGSSCDIYIPENTQLIAYARKNKEGNFSIGMCSGLVYINKRSADWVKKETEILEILKSREINYTDKTRYKEKNSFINNSLEQFKDIQLKKTYGFYEITFSSDLKIKTITTVIGFDDPVDEKLIEIFRKTEWISYNDPIKDKVKKVKEDSKLLIGIYYHKGSDENSAFLSQ